VVDELFVMFGGNVPWDTNNSVSRHIDWQCQGFVVLWVSSVRSHILSGENHRSRILPQAVVAFNEPRPNQQKLIDFHFTIIRLVHIGRGLLLSSLLVRRGGGGKEHRELLFLGQIELCNVEVLVKLLMNCVGI
jgi:hypothetical protein